MGRPAAALQELHANAGTATCRASKVSPRTGRYHVPGRTHRMPEKKKKSWSWIIRLLVAAAGVAFIVYNVTWTDHVQITGPYTHGGRTVVAQGQTASFPVIDGDVAATDPAARLTLRAGEDKNATIEVPAVAASDPANPAIQLQPGILRTISRAHLPQLLLGLALVSVIFPIQMVRWWLLLRARGLTVGLWRCFKLVMVGTFFNFCMPGTTGGDVIKAYYAARYSDRRTDSVMSIIVDRVAGLLGLVVLAAIVGLFMLHDPKVAKLTGFIWAGMLCFGVGASVYFSHRVRRALRLDKLIAMLPGQKVVTRLDEAAMAYNGHKSAVFSAIGMSVIVHLSLALATGLAGYALGMQAPLGAMLTIIPVLFLVGALPVSYLGFGVMEVVGLELFEGTGQVVATPNQIITMLLLARLYLLFYGLLGSLFLLRGDIHIRASVEDDALVTGETEDSDTGDNRSDVQPAV